MTDDDGVVDEFRIGRALSPVDALALVSALPKRRKGSSAICPRHLGAVSKPAGNCPRRYVSSA
jgi:hypothetical protein